MMGTIFDIKEMAVHDGPGIRTTVFFKGCPLKCRWCHNPEGLSFRPQLMYKEARCVKCNMCKLMCEHEECKPFGVCLKVCPENCLELSGREVSSKALIDEIIGSAQILGDNFGGFTFSGGEPLAQPQFLMELIDGLRGYHLCIETSGQADIATFSNVINKLDFVIMDIKIADSKLHKEYTGTDNNVILENFRILKNSRTPYLIRTPLIPGITDTVENLTKIKAIIGDSDWEKLPYNKVSEAKYKMLGLEYNLKST